MPKGPSPLERMYRDKSERQWQQDVRDALASFGFDFIYHTYRSDRSDPGFPDLFALNTRTGRRLAIECKREVGVLSVAQKNWGAAMAICGIEWYCLRPSEMDTLVNILREPPAERKGRGA